MEDIMQDLFETTRKRPLGISIIAILLFISAVVEIIFGLFVLFGSVFINIWAALLVGWVPLAIGILSFILAWGLWTLKPWAYWATVILEVINIAIHLFSLGQPNNSFGDIFGGGLISLIILIYLLVDRNVRVAFRT
jgi:uncharacterized membrane protein (DUF2068 family)